MKKPEFEDKICSFCEYAGEINDEDRVLCVKKGIVERDYSCRKFSLDYLKLTPCPKNLPKFSMPILGEDEE